MWMKTAVRSRQYSPSAIAGPYLAPVRNSVTTFWDPPLSSRKIQTRTLSAASVQVAVVRAGRLTGWGYMGLDSIALLP